jgi:hypothetical protein
MLTAKLDQLTHADLRNDSRGSGVSLLGFIFCLPILPERGIVVFS